MYRPSKPTTACYTTPSLNAHAWYRWNHRPALLRAALQRFGGRADWKPRWHLLAVPTEAFMGSARTVLNLAAPG